MYWLLGRRKRCSQSVRTPSNLCQATKFIGWATQRARDGIPEHVCLEITRVCEGTVKCSCNCCLCLIYSCIVRVKRDLYCNAPRAPEIWQGRNVKQMWKSNLTDMPNIAQGDRGRAFGRKAFQCQSRKS